MGGWFSDVDMEPTQEMSKLSLVGVSFFTSVIMVAGKPNGNVQNTFIATYRATQCFERPYTR